VIKKLSNITIPVSDIKEAVEFYEKVLGLKKKYKWPNYVAHYVHPNPDFVGTSYSPQPLDKIFYGYLGSHLNS